MIIKDGKRVKDFFSNAVEIANQLRSLVDVVPVNKIMEKVLRSLTQKFEHIAALMKKMKYLSKFLMNELIGSLEAHEQW